MCWWLNSLPLQLFATNAEGAHEGVAEEFLQVTALLCGLHSEDNDVLTFCLDGGLAHAVAVFFEGGNEEDALYILGFDEGVKGLHVEVGHRYHFFYGETGEGELREVVLKGLSVEVLVENAGVHVCHLLLVLAVQEDDLHFVVARAEAAVKGNAIEPVAEVGLGNATSEHALEVYDEVEAHAI